MKVSFCNGNNWLFLLLSNSFSIWMAIKLSISVSIECQVFVTKEAWDQCANGVEATMTSLLLVFFSHFFHTCLLISIFWIKSWRPMFLLINYTIYIPFKAYPKISSFAIVLGFCTIWMFWLIQYLKSFCVKSLIVHIKACRPFFFFIMWSWFHWRPIQV